MNATIVQEISTPIERLDAWMKEQGFSNPDLAEHLGFHRSFVYLIAEGQRPITSTFKWRFAEKFGHELAQEIFSENDSDNPSWVDAVAESEPLSAI